MLEPENMEREPFTLPIRVAVVVAHDASGIQICVNNGMGDATMTTETAKALREALDEALETADSIRLLALQPRGEG